MSMMDDLWGGGQSGASQDLANGYQNSIDTYNKSLDQITNLFQPWMDRGNAAGNNMMNMGNSQEAQFNNMMGNGAGGTGDWMTQYTASPWAEYQTDLGTQSANAAAAAGGMLGSGNNQRSVDTMSQGISSADRQNYYNDMMGMGAAATGNYDPLMQTGASMTGQLGGYTFGTGQEVGAAQQGIGQANAMGTAANSNMWSNMFPGLSNPMSAVNSVAGGMMGGMTGGATSSMPYYASSDQDAMNKTSGWS
jgi:hypothetical protein